MAKHGDFCLSPKVLVRVLIAFFLVTLALFMLGFMWGLLGPGMPMTGELILAAIFVLVLAYPVKVFLKYGGKEGALWSRVAGCLSSFWVGELGMDYRASLQSASSLLLAFSP
jgi:hypothetical protein